MASTVWSFPIRVVFGEESLQSLAAECRRLGARRALVITDAGVRESGVLDTALDIFSYAEISHAVHEMAKPLPTDGEVRAAAEAFRGSKFDVIVGIGGSNVMDLAKLTRIVAVHDLPLSEFSASLGGSDKITNALPAMISVPTAPAGGSEISPRATVLFEQTGVATLVHSLKLRPNAAILDPTLLRTVTQEHMARAAFRALSHCIEGYAAPGEHPLADAIALEAMRLTSAAIQAIAGDPHSAEVRTTLLKVSAMSAAATDKGLGLCQAVARCVSGACRCSQGLVHAVFLPYVLDFNRSTIPLKIARVAAALGVRSDDEETLAFESAGAVRALRKSVGLPENLRSLGLDESGLTRIAEQVIKDPALRSNPRPIVHDDVVALLRASL